MLHCPLLVKSLMSTPHPPTSVSWFEPSPKLHSAKLQRLLKTEACVYQVTWIKGWMLLNASLTLRCGVSKQFVHILVGGILSQSAHDVSDLVVSHLVVTHPVEQTKGLPVVYWKEGEENTLALFTHCFHFIELFASVCLSCLRVWLLYFTKWSWCPVFFFFNIYFQTTKLWQLYQLKQ